MAIISIISFSLCLIHLTSCYEVIPIPVGRKIKIGDGAFWDSKTLSLYFVDVYSPNATICRYDYKSNQVFCTSVDNESNASSVVPLKGCKNQFAVGLDHGIKVVGWDGRSPNAHVLRSVFQLEKDPSNTMNEAIAGPYGQLFTGTFGLKLCGSASNNSFYSYSKKNGLKRIFNDLKMNLGWTWNRKKSKFYFLDGCELRIHEFDWDAQTGDFCNRRTVFEYNNGMKELSFFPVGLSIDRKGFLYTGTYGGSSVLKIDPRTSKVVKCIKMPTQLITTPVFGGPNLDELFVTSTSLSLYLNNGQPKPDQPTDANAGSLFRIVGLGSRGWPGNKACV